MDNLLYLSLNSVFCVSIIQNDKIKEGRGVCVCVCMCVCVRMINSLLWLILKWWNNDGVKSNIRLKTLKIWPACFICCRDRCTYADKIGSIGICLNNKIFSSVLLKWCQNYGISFEHSSRETGTATGWVQEWLKWWNTAACFTWTRAEPGRVPAGSGVPQAGVVLPWFGAPPRGTMFDVSIVVRSFNRMWPSRFPYRVIHGIVM